MITVCPQHQTFFLQAFLDAEHRSVKAVDLSNIFLALSKSS